MVAGSVTGVIFGTGQVKLLTEGDKLIFKTMDGMKVYVIEATKYEEAWIRLVSYLHVLEQAPVWEIPEKAKKEKPNGS